MVLELENQDAWHEIVQKFWRILERSSGNNPFSIAASQGLSLTFHDADSPLPPDDMCYSQFRPDVLAIDIFTVNLDRFWDEMFPGCAPESRYRYACWRELWHFWMHARFAPLKISFGDDWLYFLESFSKSSFLQSEYLAQYFAALATSVIERDRGVVSALNKVSVFQGYRVQAVL